MSALPEPLLERWQPLRLGLRNLYRYDQEEFRFAGGRLLLRGNNGTGKTRVLALTLPFLLDGEVSPARIEPDGNRNRRIEWHLLLDRYPERTGYAWLEFGRLDGGIARYCTIGCGMRAMQGHQGLRGRWFFVSQQRIGSNLELASTERVPWSRDQLREALGTNGTVYDTAESYRHAIDERLFGLGEHRYRALIDLLIELRRPQLSRELDEDRLSSALSQALPPVSQDVLDVVAESYRALERERNELLGMDRAAGAVGEFNQIQRRAVQVHAAGSADRVASTHGRYEDAQGAVRSASDAHRLSLAAYEQAQGQLIASEHLQAQAAGEERALESSEAMRSAKHLDRMQEEAARARDVAEQTEADAGRVGSELSRRKAQLSDAAQAERGAVDSCERAAAAARAAMSEIGPPPAAAPAQDLASALGADLPNRRRAARQLGEREQVLADRTSAQHAIQGRVVDAEAYRDRAQTQVEAAESELELSAAAVIEATVAHQRTLRALTVDADIVAKMPEWVRDPASESPYGLALAAAAAAGRSHWAHHGGELRAQLTAAERKMAEMRAEADQLRAGHDPGPPVPAWRTGAARAQRAGAPLWRLCEFREQLSEAERAGLEAALQAAELLDAWVHPDGRLERADGDVCLIRAPELPQGSNLAALLQPAIDTGDCWAGAVTAATLNALLAGIAIHPPSPAATTGSAPAGKAPAGGSCAEPAEPSPHGPLWVGSDGCWGNGPLHGRWHKEAAEHLGAGARSATRRRRLEAIATELARLAGEAERLAAALRASEEQLRWIEHELSSQPDPLPLRSAWLHHRQRLGLLAEARDLLAVRQSELATAAAATALAVAARTQLAEDCQLLAWVGRPTELRDAIEEAQRRLAALSVQVQAVRQGRERAGVAAEEVARVLAQHGPAFAQAARMRAHATSISAEADTLQLSLGATVADLMARLQQVRERQTKLAVERRRAESSRSQAHGEIGRTGEAERHSLERLEDATRERGEALAALLQLSTGGMLTGLGGEFLQPLPRDASDTRVLDLARALRRDSQGVARDPATADRLAAQVSAAIQQLQAVLSSSDLRPITEFRHQLMVVMVPFQGADRTTVELESLLRADAANRHLLLSAREREVIENFLIDEAANDLHLRLHHAEEWLARVNAELSERPMSTGLALRFRWLPSDDGPEGIAEARERLLRPSQLWSPDDRGGLATFLQRRIHAARDGLSGGTWQEQLAIALDYRLWHRFTIERRQDGRWQRLTRRTHGTGSGGEKAVSLTMPQFAAAAAHYQAAPLAPRLILLDEAFVGIDGDMRRKCMGLLAAFDLDVVMTSEREWGCYDTVPALAIYQLAASEGGSCVTATRYVWDGRRRVRDGADDP